MTSAVANTIAWFRWWFTTRDGLRYLARRVRVGAKHAQAAWPDPMARVDAGNHVREIVVERAKKEPRGGEGERDG